MVISLHYRFHKTPTLYDHLILSLRDKDVIATFNWDPFLIQAYRRNHKTVKSLPKIVFLHGNVLSGYCRRDNIHGTKNGRCAKCGQPYTPSQLLYPIKTKDYNSDPEISSQWEFLKDVLKHALVVTIFGYGAPASDAAAIDILSQAWGGNLKFANLNKLRLSISKMTKPYGIIGRDLSTPIIMKRITIFMNHGLQIIPAAQLRHLVMKNMLQDLLNLIQSQRMFPSPSYGVGIVHLLKQKNVLMI